MIAVIFSLGHRARTALIGLLIANAGAAWAQPAAPIPASAPEIQAVAEADQRWAHEKSAQQRGIQQLLYGQQMARDALKQSIDAVRAELATASSPGARAEIEARIAACVQALNDLRLAQASEVEAREREAKQLATTFQAERTRLVASARGSIDYGLRAAQQRRDSARDRLDTIRRTIADLDQQRAIQTADLAAARDASELRRREAEADLTRRSDAILEPVAVLALQAQTTTYMDERAKIHREIEAKQREAIALREDVILEQARRDNRDRQDQATRAASIDALGARIAGERVSLQSLMAEEREATVALQALDLDAGRLGRLQVSVR